MRILFIVHQFRPEFSSGTETVTLHLAQAAQRMGHHVQVLTASVRRDVRWPRVDSRGLKHAVVEGVPVCARAQTDSSVEQLGFEIRTRDGHLERNVDAFIRGGQFDVAHVMHAMRMLPAVQRIRQLSIPYIMTATDFFLPCYRINLVREDGAICAGANRGEACISHCAISGIQAKFLSNRYSQLNDIIGNAAAVTVPSPFVKNVMIREYPYLKPVMIPHGIDLLRFRRGAVDDTHARGPEITFGYLGTISAEKGVLTLAKAFNRLGPMSPAKLVLVGPVFDSRLRAELEQLAAKNSAISLLGPASAEDVVKTLRSFDVLCLPSELPETFSLTLHEGFAAELPCLVSDIGNLGDVVRANECGAAIPAGDLDAWEGAMRGVLRDPAILERWKLKAPTPMRLEEEAFFYDQLYRRAHQPKQRT